MLKQRTLSKLSRNQTWQPPITKQDDDKEKKSRCHAIGEYTGASLDKNCYARIFFWDLPYLDLKIVRA